LKKDPKFFQVLFYSDNSKRAGGYKNGIISINTNLIKNDNDLYTFLYHESIHKIQDQKSSINIFSIILSNRIKLDKKDLMNFNISNYFEIMAYASTFAILIKFHLINIKEFDTFLLNSKYKEVYQIIKKSKNFKKFKKYLYLYYKEIVVQPSIIEEKHLYTKDKEELLDGFSHYIK